MITPSIPSAVSMATVAAAKASTTSGSSGAVGGDIIGSEICVIGAGAAGLVTARHLIRCGLRPTLFDTALDVGGLWNSNKRHSSGNGKNSINNNGKTWNSLRTNLSRYTCSFSDYPWSLVPNKKGTSNDKVNSVENEEGDALSFFFPTADQVHEYLQSYSNHYLKDHCIFHLGCEVSKVTRAPDNQGYVIEWRKPTNQQPPQQEDQGQQQEVVHRKVFGGVVVATGFFSKPAWPRGADLTAFPGLTCTRHSIAASTTLERQTRATALLPAKWRYVDLPLALWKLQPTLPNPRRPPQLLLLILRPISSAFFPVCPGFFQGLYRIGNVNIVLVHVILSFISVPAMDSKRKKLWSMIRP